MSIRSLVEQEVKQRGVVDPARIAVGGHSYGAFMAANLLAHAPDLFACGIARSGAYNRYVVVSCHSDVSLNTSPWPVQSALENMAGGQSSMPAPRIHPYNVWTLKNPVSDPCPRRIARQIYVPDASPLQLLELKLKVQSDDFRCSQLLCCSQQKLRYLRCTLQSCEAGRKNGSHIMGIENLPGKLQTEAA